MAARAHAPVEDLECQIDAILEAGPSPGRKLARRRLAVTEENMRRLFGVSLWDLFRALAGHFGYIIEDETHPKAP